MDGIQAWVALPREQEEIAPGFWHHGGEHLPAFEADGVWGRLIAGDAWGLRSPVQTHSPMAYTHCRLAQGATLAIPADYPERAVYIAEGTVEIDHQTFGTGRMVVLAAGKSVVVSAVAACTLMVLAGEPVGERIIDWNFVSSSRERIDQAKADWRAGRMKLPDLDDAEFIPLPADPLPAPNPMS
jgi:redox-sensitive bicupin YhaK (pirin superfamily)